MIGNGSVLYAEEVHLCGGEWGGRQQERNQQWYMSLYAVIAFEPL